MLTLLLLAAAAAQAETRFLSAADDIPLPSGWAEQEGAVFEGRDGRLVEANAAGSGTAASAHAFYRTTLPALGWAALPGEALIFLRGRERLTITLREADGRTAAHFVIAISPASMALD